MNEQATLASCIKGAQDSNASLGLSGAILVTDKGSTYVSIEIAKSLNARVVNVEQKGYGSALIRELEQLMANS